MFFGIFLSFILAGLYSSTYYSDNQSIAFIILAVINIFQGSNAGALLYFAKIKRKQPIISKTFIIYRFFTFYMRISTPTKLNIHVFHVEWIFESGLLDYCISVYTIGHTLSTRYLQNNRWRSKKTNYLVLIGEGPTLHCHNIYLY